MALGKFDHHGRARRKLMPAGKVEPHGGEQGDVFGGEAEKGCCMVTWETVRVGGT
jgi:hypothetical protein